jgi:hypothetical protein
MSLSTALTQRVAADAFTSPTMGAPGVYFVPAVPAHGLAVESMDVAAFVGVAPRGPAWETTTDPGVNEAMPFRARSIATPVDSWDDYLELYGAFEGPGLLPHAVSAYFAQGGRRAYVVRVVAAHSPAPAPTEVPNGCATLALKASQNALPWLSLAARNEGTWGNRLSLSAQFTLRRIHQEGHHEPGSFTGASTPRQTGGGLANDELKLPALSMVTRGTTLRFTPPIGRPQQGNLAVIAEKPFYRIVLNVSSGGSHGTSSPDLVVRLDNAVDKAEGTNDLDAYGPGWTVDVVEVDLLVSDRDPDRPRQERFQALGLDARHPRYLTDFVNNQSRLLQIPTQIMTLSPTVSALGFLTSELTASGVDRWSELELDDVFARATEPDWTGGVGVVDRLEEVATIVVPDLYAPTIFERPVHTDPPDNPSNQFTRCLPPLPPKAPPDDARIIGLALDPTDPQSRAKILVRQQQLIEQAERMRRVVLLDVPPRLTSSQVVQWRAALGSAFAAAYHPWLVVPAAVDHVRHLPPSAFAAGIIARSELRVGIARGPANELAAGVVDVDVVVTPQDHASLHRLGVNVFALDLDGIRLTAARTLSADSAWRQLSVRRLLLSIERTVSHSLQWTVFELNDDRLRDGLRKQLNGLLGALFEQGCFAGATPAESWFVAIADKAAARAEADAGQLVVQIGVAPAEPMEFIIVRVSVQAEGTITSSTSTGSG